MEAGTVRMFKRYFDRNEKHMDELVKPFITFFVSLQL